MGSNASLAVPSERLDAILCFSFGVSLVFSEIFRGSPDAKTGFASD